MNKILLMSVCVSSALTSGMQMSHMPSLASSMSMMQPLQPHPMAPTSSLLTNNMTNIDLSNSQPHNQLLHSQQQIPNNVNDPNEPNSDMLLALIARNKSLEGEFINNLFYCHFITTCRRNILRSYQFSVFLLSHSVFWYTERSQISSHYFQWDFSSFETFFDNNKNLFLLPLEKQTFDQH